jgi:hypothetical protein
MELASVEEGLPNVMRFICSLFNVSHVHSALFGSYVCNSPSYFLCFVVYF